VIYRIDHDAILVLSLFSKKTRETPGRIIKETRRLLAAYDSNDRMPGD
jgi:phage-related protein